LAINNAGGVSINPDGTDAGTSKVATLSIAGASSAWTARLDLSNNGLVVDYTGSSPFAQIENQLKQGYNNGSWNANGITSSAAAATRAATNKTALGISEAAAMGVSTF